MLKEAEILANGWSLRIVSVYVMTNDTFQEAFHLDGR